MEIGRGRVAQWSVQIKLDIPLDLRMPRRKPTLVDFVRVSVQGARQTRSARPSHATAFPSRRLNSGAGTVIARVWQSGVVLGAFHSFCELAVDKPVGKDNTGDQISA